MPELPNKMYVRGSEVRAFLEVDARTFRKMTWDAQRDPAKEKSARLFHAIHLPGYAWPVFKRSQVLAALERAEAKG